MVLPNIHSSRLDDMHGSTVVSSKARSIAGSGPLHWVNNAVAKLGVTRRIFTFSFFQRRLVDPVAVVLTLFACLTAFRVDPEAHYQLLALLAALLSSTVFGVAGHSQHRRFAGYWDESVNVVFCWLVVFALILLIGYLFKSSQYFSRRVLLSWFVLTPGFILGTRLVLRTLRSRMGRRYKAFNRAVILGVNPTGLQLAQELAGDASLGVKLDGWFDDRAAERVSLPEGQTLLGTMSEVAEYVRDNRVAQVYVCLPIVMERRIKEVLRGLRDTTTAIYFVPDIHLFDLIQARISSINGLPVLAINASPFVGVNVAVKRAVDVVLSLMILTALSSLMLTLAVAVKFTSPGPVLFKQRRYGVHGEEFMIYKFRTLTVVQDGAHIPQVKKGDARLTRLGGFLRRHSLDELPQFINVLQGRMSIVGPRPHAVAHNEMYRRLVDGYMVRHIVRPGITGWAQVHGLRGEIKTLDEMKSRVHYDLEYVRHWSLGLDLNIMLKTVRVMKDSRAY